MSIFKRGRIYWYKFMWQGRLVRESTKQGNDKVARQMEAAQAWRRARLASGRRSLFPRSRSLSRPGLSRGAMGASLRHRRRGIPGIAQDCARSYLMRHWRAASSRRLPASMLMDSPRISVQSA